MKIIVIGAGKVGSTLAAQLVKEGHEVIVMDTNQVRLDELQNRIDIMTLCGNGASK